MAKMYCDQCNITHTPLMCFNKPRGTILKNKKAVNRFGKVSAEWMVTRNKWIQANPPIHDDRYWECYICREWLSIERLTLDHKKSRSRHPELRYNLDNLAACCIHCNKWKGSRDLIQI